jgi:uncharacterized YccA/Bax inhibitor family protein
MGSNPIGGTGELAGGDLSVTVESMQSNNPVLTRYEKKPTGYYEEGRAAFAAASGQAPTATAQAPTAPAGTPPSTPEDFATITAAGGLRVTLNDVVVKCAIMFAIVVATAFVGWNLIGAMPVMMLPALVIATVLGIVNAVKKNVSPALMIIFAVFEGLMLGGISNFYNAYASGNGWDGVVLQAVVATMTTFGVMLILYMTGVIKVTKRFTQILLVAGVSYLVLALASMVASFFGVGGGWGFYGVDGIGIIISIVGVALAALFLALDFEAIKQGIAMGLPERESWRMAFGLLVTLVWLYLEFLRLLSIFSGRE